MTSLHISSPGRGHDEEGPAQTTARFRHAPWATTTPTATSTKSLIRLQILRTPTPRPTQCLERFRIRVAPVADIKVPAVTKPLLRSIHTIRCRSKVARAQDIEIIMVTNLLLRKIHTIRRRSKVARVVDMRIPITIPLLDSFHMIMRGRKTVAEGSVQRYQSRRDECQ